MLVLLSPAKTLDNETPSRTKKVTMPQFLNDSEQLVGVLKKYNSKKLSSLITKINPSSILLLTNTLSQ